MVFFLFFLTALLAATDAIFDGHDASIKDFPYHATIKRAGYHVCGGSIINSNWIITTAKCVDLGSAEDYKVRVGLDEWKFWELWSTDGNPYQVDKIIKHQNYSEIVSLIYANNVALVRVKEPFVFDETRQPIELFRTGEKLAPGTMANVTGFGWAREFTNRLQSIEVPTMDLDACNAAFKAIGGVPEGHICAAYEDYEDGGKNACWDDKGGPLVVDGRLAGMVSWSRNGFLKPHYPVLYTDVAHYRQWVDENILL